MNALLRRHGQSILEYIFVVTVILLVMVAFSKYMARGIYGRWKGVGDSIGFGRYYDPKKTVECTFTFPYFNGWVNATCYEDTCDCLSLQATNVTCQTCIQSCITPICSGAAPPPP